MPDAVEPGPVPPPGAWPRRPALTSFVIPVFREADGLLHFGESLLAVMDGLGLRYEVIFVEDDSPDASMDRVRELHARRPEVVRGLSMSRRFGHQASLAAGFDEAAGDVVICMDSDMQHPPELVPFLLWKWSEGHQLVYTRRRAQAGRGRLKALASRLFYKAINQVSDVQLEDGTADFRLMDRVVVDALRRFSERWLFYRGLAQWAGFRRLAVHYDAPPRFAYALFTLAWWIAGAGVPGYTSLVLLVCGIGGLNLFCLGVVGEYVGRIHEQVKQRPLYLVKERIGFAPAHAPARAA